MKKALSILIVLLLMAAMLPVAAFADTPNLYSIWVGGVQVSSANKDDITSAINDAVPGSASGTATYDPATGTLTLNNFSYSGSGYLYDTASTLECYASVYAKSGIAIKLIGDNSVACAGESISTMYRKYAGIASDDDCSITICDDPTDSTAGKISVSGNSRGIECGADLTIKDCSAEVSSYVTEAIGSDLGAAIWCDNLLVQGSELEAKAASGELSLGAIGVYCRNATTENSTVIAYGDSSIDIPAGWFYCGFSANTVTIGDTDEVYADDTEADAAGPVARPISDDTYSNKYVRIQPGSFAVTYADENGQAENGSYSADKTSAKAGEKVTITATPATGYEVDKVTYTTPDGAETEIAADGGEYSFDMPNKDVVVKVSFKEAAAPSNPGQNDETPTVTVPTETARPNPSTSARVEGESTNAVFFAAAMGLVLLSALLLRRRAER